jgi:hypothetical protein
MFAFLSNRLGCLGSIVVSVIGTLILLAALRQEVCDKEVNWRLSSPKKNASPEASTRANPMSFAILFIAANNRY